MFSQSMLMSNFYQQRKILMLFKKFLNIGSKMAQFFIPPPYPPPPYHSLRLRLLCTVVIKSWTSLLLAVTSNINKPLYQWLPNFSGARTTLNNLVVRKAKNIDSYIDAGTITTNLADPQWSMEHTLGITTLYIIS